MGSIRPKIGIIPAFDYKENRLYLKDGYFEAVNEAGGLAAILSITKDESIIDEYIKVFDGFLLTGGPDVDPRYYGEPNLPFNDEISPCRDYLEILAVKKAFEYGKPILGICRGIQVINVALGGTLYQDIYAQVRDRELIKHSQSGPRWYPTHKIKIEHGSSVWKSFSGKDQVYVNSLHHQAVKDTAPGFRATSYAEDGLIESIECPGHAFCTGVQWHPELMWKEDREYLNVFIELVEMAAK